jgi:hypothetical protein
MTRLTLLLLLTALTRGVWGEDEFGGRLNDEELHVRIDAGGRVKGQNTNKYQHTTSSVLIPVARDDEIDIEEYLQPSERQLRKVKRRLSSRKLAKSKGKGSKGSKGDDMLDHCNVLEIFVFKKEVEEATVATDFGFSVEVDVYDPEDEKETIGSWSQQVAYTSSKQNSGVGNILFALNNNAGISMQTVLGQRAHPVTGGTGRFGNCLGGFAESVKETNTRQYIDIYYCQTC